MIYTKYDNSVKIEKIEDEIWLQFPEETREKAKALGERFKKLQDELLEQIAKGMCTPTLPLEPVYGDILGASIRYRSGVPRLMPPQYLMIDTTNT